MHSLGFYHEHARSDRDLYIKIVEKNVRPGVFLCFVLFLWHRLGVFFVFVFYLSFSTRRISQQFSQAAYFLTAFFHVQANLQTSGQWETERLRATLTTITTRLCIMDLTFSGDKIYSLVQDVTYIEQYSRPHICHFFSTEIFSTQIENKNGINFDKTP